MKFSVVIPTFNRAQVLRKCLDALAAQTHADYDVIVVNDGSTDETERVVQSYPFARCINQPHQGGAHLLNVGWRNGTGDMILMTDDDCIGPPNWLAALEEGIRRYPAAIAVGSYAGPPDAMIITNRFARYDDWEWKIHGGKLTEYIGGAETPTAGLVAYRRAALEAVNGFNEKLMMAGAHDHDIKQRLAARGYKFLYLPLKIEHHKPYSADSFYQQHIGRGRAAFRYECQSLGKNPSYFRLALRALKQVFVLIKHLVVMRDMALVWTIFQAGWFNCIGQWREKGAQGRRGRASS